MRFLGVLIEDNWGLHRHVDNKIIISGHNLQPFVNLLILVISAIFLQFFRWIGLTGHTLISMKFDLISYLTYLGRDDASEKKLNYLSIFGTPFCRFKNG